MKIKALSAEERLDAIDNAHAKVSRADRLIARQKAEQLAPIAVDFEKYAEVYFSLLVVHSHHDRIIALTAEIKSVKARLICATTALHLTDHDLERLQRAAIELGELFRGDTSND